MNFDQWIAKDGAANDSAHSGLLRRCWDASAKATRESIIDYMNATLTCPCCLGVLECEEGCTFAEDCPHEAENLESLREALRP